MRQNVKVLPLEIQKRIQEIKRLPKRRRAVVFKAASEFEESASARKKFAAYVRVITNAEQAALKMRIVVD